MAARARADVVEKRDMRVMTEHLVDCYRSEVAACGPGRVNASL